MTSSTATCSTLGSGRFPPRLLAATASGPPGRSGSTARGTCSSRRARKARTSCTAGRGKYEHTFGYYEARCRMQTQPGFWSAFWMYTPEVGRVGDARRDGTEIDIFEKPRQAEHRDRRLGRRHQEGQAPRRLRRRSRPCVRPGGREEALSEQAPSRGMPPTLTLPHEGGGDHVITDRSSRVAGEGFASLVLNPPPSWGRAGWGGTSR